MAAGNHPNFCHRENYETVFCFRNVGYGPWRRSDRLHRLRWIFELNASAAGCVHHQLHGKCGHHHGGTKHDPDGGVRERNRRDYAGESSRDKRNGSDRNTGDDNDLYAHCDSIEWVGCDGDCHHHCEPVAHHRELRGQPGDDHGGTERDADRRVCQRHGCDYSGQYCRHNWDGGYR